MKISYKEKYIEVDPAERILLKESKYNSSSSSKYSNVKTEMTNAEMALNTEMTFPILCRRLQIPRLLFAQRQEYYQEFLRLVLKMY